MSRAKDGFGRWDGVCACVFLCVCASIWERDDLCIWASETVPQGQPAPYDTNDIYSFNKNIYIHAFVSACKDFWAMSVLSSMKPLSWLAWELGVRVSLVTSAMILPARQSPISTSGRADTRERRKFGGLFLSRQGKEERRGIAFACIHA